MKPSERGLVMRDEWLTRWGLGRETSDCGKLAGERPFSFLLGGASCRQLVASWEYTVETGRDADRCCVHWQDRMSGICLTAEIRRFDPFDAIYYVLHIANDGTGDTPILESILPLNAGVRLPHGGPVVLHHANGCTTAIDDFLPLETQILEDTQVTLEPGAEGRPSNGVLPFFNLTWPGGGLVTAIGWTGQWRAMFGRDTDGRLRLSAGMAKTHLLLHPGESIRTPGILLLPWEGQDWLIGQNKLRKLMLAHFTPRCDGQAISPPVAHATSAGLHMYEGGWAGGNEQTQLASIRSSAPLGIEAYWLDAYWFPGNFPNGVGNWFHREADFPRGLRPLSSAAHAAGMKFILWFEPERVGPDTQLDREHPEWLLAHGDGCKLLDLGNPEARRHITDLISGIITAAGVDVYRQDFCIKPLPYWQANDAPDRQGMTEIRHVEGLYAFWDELRVRHPGLWIDNCAGGGQRIDLETCARSLVLWRSDTPDPLIWDEPARLSAGVSDQVQTAGLSLFVPLHSGGVWGLDPYRFRSAMHSGVVIYDDPRQPGFPREQAIQAIEELKSLRPYFLGDFYPLTRITTSEEDWCAYQYHRPDLNDGFAVYFCRRQCASLSLPARLRELDPFADYHVVIRETYDPSQRRDMKGAELVSSLMSVSSRPGSVLLTYEKTSP
ncbi:MAG: glycoside hydrolase family 36 protein [Candidatus Latescibacterota bacterium]